MTGTLGLKERYDASISREAYVAALAPKFTDFGPAVEMLDPESMLAFFETQMNDAKRDLNAMIQQQEHVNARITRLQSLDTTLTQYAQSGIKPGDKDWDTFVAAAREAQQAVGESSTEGQQIQALLDEATKPTLVDKRFSTESAAQAYALAKQHGTSVGTVKTTMGFLKTSEDLVVSVPEGPAKGLTKEQVTKLSSLTKAVSEGLKSDSSIRMIRVQQAVEKCSQIVNLASNIMRKLNEMAMAPINNMRG